MRDHEHSSIRAKLGNRFLDQRLRATVEVARRLVEYEDVGIPQQHPSDGDPLALTSRKAVAPVSNLGLVTIRQPDNEVMCLRRLRRLPDNLLDAVRLFDKSKVARAGLGDAFVTSYVKLKHDEWARYAASLSDWEIENTLDC